MTADGPVERYSRVGAGKAVNTKRDGDLHCSDVGKLWPLDQSSVMIQGLEEEPCIQSTSLIGCIISQSIVVSVVVNPAQSAVNLQIPGTVLDCSPPWKPMPKAANDKLGMRKSQKYVRVTIPFFLTFKSSFCVSCLPETNRAR